MRQEIRISGFGGQGVITAGIILAKAAALEGFEVLQTQSYGSEARGGACKADVTVSDSAINDLSVENADILVCMSKIALSKYLATLKPGGILIVDSDLVDTGGMSGFDGRLVKVPATTMVGRKNANMAMVATLASIARFAGTKNLEAAIAETLPDSSGAIKAARDAFQLCFQSKSSNSSQ